MSIFRRKKEEHDQLRLEDIPEGEFPDAPVKVGEKDMDQLVKRFPRVAVDFWAPWCRPCLAMALVIEALAKDYKGEIVFAKLNVDKEQKMAVRYQVMNIPTIVVFKDGKPVNRIAGAMPKNILEKALLDMFE